MAQMIDLSQRAKLQLTGPQALWFLDQLITNRVVELETGSGAEALLLTPKGRITAVLRVLCTSDGVLADLQAAEPQAVVSFLTMRIFATRVQIVDATSDFALLRVVGADAGQAVVAALDAVAPAGPPHSLSEFESGHLVRLAPPLEGLDIWAVPAAKDYISMKLARTGVQDASGDEYQAYRVQAGSALFGVDFDSTFLPQEAAFEHGVHFNKGCYLGQEAVAMAQRGKVKRRLRHLQFAGPAEQGELFYQGAAAGTVTSAAGTSGIAVVKTLVPLEAQVEVAGVSALVKALPGTVEGPSVPSARELRERLSGR